MRRKKETDRRNYIRFLVQDGVVAVPRSYSAVRIGRILDISSKGLSVRYSGEKGWLNDIHQIDVLFVDTYDYLSKLPVQIVSDNKLTDASSTNNKEERRCGLQFRNLSGQQLFKLEQFILKFAVGKAWGNHALRVPKKSRCLHPRSR